METIVLSKLSLAGLCETVWVWDYQCWRSLLITLFAFMENHSLLPSLLNLWLFLHVSVSDYDTTEQQHLDWFSSQVVRVHWAQTAHHASLSFLVNTTPPCVYNCPKRKKTSSSWVKLWPWATQACSLHSTNHRHTEHERIHVQIRTTAEWWSYSLNVD